MRYPRNVTGTHALQVGIPTIFWTLSLAEFHWSEFRSLLSEYSLDSETLRTYIVNNQYTLMRDSIHCYGLTKLEGDPGLCNLSQIPINPNPPSTGEWVKPDIHPCKINLIKYQLQN